MAATPVGPTADQLARFFHLADTDRELIATRRGDHNRLGFAPQLCTVRCLGTFLEAPPKGIPESAVNNVAHQLTISDLPCTILCGRAAWGACSGDPRILRRSGLCGLADTFSAESPAVCTLLDGQQIGPAFCLIGQRHSWYPIRSCGPASVFSKGLFPVFEVAFRSGSGDC
jgi:hypothetical protein